MPEAPSLLRAVPRGGSAILGVTSRPSPAPWDPRCQLPEQSERQSADFSELKTLFCQMVLTPGGSPREGAALSRDGQRGKDSYFPRLHAAACKNAGFRQCSEPQPLLLSR